jgi:CubicO group peptidase (beta-lactamase class C family)
MLSSEHMPNKSNYSRNEIGMVSKDSLESLLDEAVSQNLCTGAAAAVAADGKTLWLYCVGATGREERPLQDMKKKKAQGEISPTAIRSETRFDAASLTKPLSTALLTLKAFQAGALKLDHPVEKFLPELNRKAGKIPLIALLTHTGGMPAIPALQRYFPNPVHLDRKSALSKLFSIEPELPVGQHVQYSCTGYILVGTILERVSGMPVGELFQQEIARPLNLPHATFAQSVSGSGEPVPLEDTVETEFCSWRRKRMHGQVHDESAYCLGGHSGNAGLFLSLKDALIFGDFILQEGAYDGKQILKPEISQLLQRERTPGLEERRAIGFRLHDNDTADGPLWPAQAFGHTGFTGTSIFFEPQRRLFAILFTNRVYYGRDATANAIVALRKEFYTRVWHLFS